MIHSKPNVGKTQLLQTLAHSINTGRPFLGRWPTQKGPVVVVQADMTGQIQQDRVRKVYDLIELDDTYWVVEKDGAIPLIDITRMTFTDRALVEAMREIDPVMCAWDTLRKIHRLPENDSASPVTVFQSAQEILPTSTHGYLHHDRKQNRDPKAEEIPEESFMGNVQWWGAGDTTLQLEELPGGPPNRIKLRWHKARTAAPEEKEPLVLEMDSDTMLLLPVDLSGQFG